MLAGDGSTITDFVFYGQYWEHFESLLSNITSIRSIRIPTGTPWKWIFCLLHRFLLVVLSYLVHTVPVAKSLLCLQKLYTWSICDSSVVLWGGRQHQVEPCHSHALLGHPDLLVRKFRHLTATSSADIRVVFNSSSELDFAGDLDAKKLDFPVPRSQRQQ